jgi:hypothetical protein
VGDKKRSLAEKRDASNDTKVVFPPKMLEKLANNRQYCKYIVIDVNGTSK